VAEIEGGAFVANNACDAGNGCTDALTTISPYRLDVYEVTVGRFRKFVNDGYGTADNPPRANDGQHPKLEFSGWSAAWKEQLRPRKVDLSAALDGCAQGFGTWNQDSLVPVTCVTWYEAFAFCIYDGGRLPTEAEWSFAATGGSDQRLYPWGSLDPAVDAGAPAFASFCPAGITDGGGAPTIDGFNCTASPTAERVGTFSPQGDGRFGNADLAGNAFEYVFDWWSEPPPFPCKDCAVQTQGLTATDRVVRGGSWRASKGAMRNSARYHVSPGDRDSTKVPTIGFRCARDYP
jgi:formylglycine-generating enzyme required for sulfatase activity